MTNAFARPSYLLQWDHACAMTLGSDTVVAKHRLGELSLASDQQLARLLDRCAADQLRLFTMGENLAHPTQWQAQTLKFASGSGLLKQIRSGRLYVVIKDVASIDEVYGSLTSRLYEEIAECNPGFRSSAHAADLVLASPGTAQYFNVDHQPGIRWQLRGSQTVITYPSTSTLVDERAVEDAVLDGAKAGLYYEPEFERSAQGHTFKSSQLFSMPHPTPHRSEFSGDLCVWVQTLHHTPQSLKRKNIAAANRVSSRFLPAIFTRPQQAGFIAAAKNMLSAAVSLADRVSQSATADAACCRAEPPSPATPSSPASSRFGGLADRLSQNNLPIPGTLTGSNPSTFTTVVSEN